MSHNTFQIITSYPLSCEPVINNRLLPFIRIAISHGYRVSLVSPDLNKFIIPGYDFDHICCPPISTKPKGFIKRAMFENKEAKRLLKAANRVNSDFRFITIPSMFLLFNTSLIRSGKVVIDVRDLVWEYIPTKSILGSFSKKFFKKLAIFSIKKSDLLITTNKTEVSYLKELCPNVDILHVSNGISQEQFNKLAHVSLLDMGDPAPSVAYIGNVGLAQDLRYFINVAKDMPRVNFYIIGEGTDFENIKDYASRLKVKNVNILGQLAWDEVVGIYNEVNILYAQLTPEFQTAMPSKLYEYLSTGKYIVYGGTKQAETVLNCFDHNIVIQPCNNSELKSALEKIISEGYYKNNSLKNRDLIEKEYIREVLVENFFEYIGPLAKVTRQA